MKHKIAMIGSREAVTGFALLGVDSVPVSSPEQGVEELYRLKKEMTPEGSSQ